MLKKATNQFVRLDTDTDNNSIGQGDGQGSYRYALNCRIRSSKDGNAGATENVRGNVEIENTFLPAGTNTCIGTCQDDTNNRLIFFNHNSNGQHGIYQYNEVDDSIKAVFVNTVVGLDVNDVLNFDTEHLITHTGIIEDLLFWTDGQTSIREINIARALANEYVLPNIKQQTYLLKEPPHYPPRCVYKKNDKIVHNYIASRLFQFAIRYVYLDNEKTTLSPFSEIPIDSQSINPKISLYNYISVNYGADLVGNDLPIKNNIAYASLIKAVEIFVRGSDYVVDTNGLNRIQVNRADWKLVATVKDYAAQNFIYDFYNDENFQVAPSEETNKLYDSVPITSQALAIKDNRVFLGNNLEDYDNEPIDIELDVSFADYGVQEEGSTDPDFFEFRASQTDIPFETTEFISSNIDSTFTPISPFDDTTLPNFDTSNSFLVNAYTSKIAGTMTFTYELTITDWIDNGFLVKSALRMYKEDTAGIVTVLATTIITADPSDTDGNGTYSVSAVVNIEKNEKVFVGIAGEGGSVVCDQETSTCEYFVAKIQFNIDSSVFSNEITDIAAVAGNIAGRGSLKRGGAYQYTACVVCYRISVTFIEIN